MALSAGTRLGNFEILAPLGAGGMGEVYRARDTKLGREVAIKVLPDSLVQDVERLARFGREAKLLASLNHPNIATLHGLEEWESKPFLVMELVEGETLAERLKRGPMPIDEAIPMFIGIAEGLEAAHEKGIIHRDLKPANIKIGPNGKPKILDFGLATALADPIAQSDLAESPTITKGTAVGVILGTAHYMSPEQARGKSLDRRTDVWSFGCVLYEALTSKRAFEGDTLTDVLSAVLRGEPDLSALPAAVPRTVEHVLRRCLVPDATRRLHDIADARIELESQVESAPPSNGFPSRTRIRMAALVFLSLAIGLLIGAGINRSETANVHQRPVRFSLRLPDDEFLAVEYLQEVLAISPDGNLVAYIARRPMAASRREAIPRLVLRQLDSEEPNSVTGTEGAMSLFFAPDSKSIGIVVDGRKLLRVSSAGGAPEVLADVSITGGYDSTAAKGGSWGADGSILFSPGGAGGLVHLSSGGATSADFLTSPDPARHETSHRWPKFLPDGTAALFTVKPEGIASWDEARIDVVSLQTRKWKTVVEGGVHARYSPTGHIIFARHETLMAAPFDLERHEVTGPPVALPEDVYVEPRSGAAQFSFSETGTLAYVPNSVEAMSRNLVWIDRKGNAQRISDASGLYSGPCVSPDGKFIALVLEGASDDLWVQDLDRGSLTRLTFHGNQFSPTWSPDGRRIAFASDRGGQWNLFVQSGDGSSEAERLTTSENSQYPGSFSPDGRALAFSESTSATNWDIYILPLDGDHHPRPFVKTEFNEANPRFSPDGKFIAYASEETGRPQVFIRAYPEGNQRMQISTDGGTEPAWSRDGRELFYWQGDEFMVVSVVVAPSLTVGRPHKLFSGHFGQGTYSGTQTFDVAPDGRFVMAPPASPDHGPREIRVVLNWFEELKRLVPTK